MTQISESDLANGTVDIWYDWLRAGLIIFTGPDTIPARYDAFAPLMVDPQSATPASDLVEQIRTVNAKQSGAVESAAIEALRTWAPAIDGWRPATLLISVAARLGGRSLADAILGLVGRSANLPADARAELAYVAVQAASLRFKFQEIASLALLLWEEELCSPSLLADLALLIARRDHGGLREMPAKLAKLLPALMTPPHTGNYASAIAKTLRLRLGPEDLIRGLSPVEGEDRPVADFRSVLLQIAAPRAAEIIESRKNNVVNFPYAASNDLVANRLSGMEDIASLPFPEALDGVSGEGSKS